MWLRLRGGLFWFGFIIITIILTSIISLSFIFPIGFRYRLARLWSNLILGWLKLSCGLSYEVVGLEHTKNLKSAVIMGNHQSTWETIACQLWFEPTVWVVKRELMWIPIFGWALAFLRPIAITRQKGKKAVEQLLGMGTERLAQNSFIIIFPEGTRVPYGGKARYKIGGALLAAKTGAPVIPFAHNAGKFWAKRKIIKKPGCVKVVFGKPIYTQGLSPEEINRQVETWIRSTQETL